MLYNVYEQLAPVKTERKDRDNRNVYEANIQLIGETDVPSNKDPIEYVRDRYGIKFPLVSAVNGYTDEGKVRLACK